MFRFVKVVVSTLWRWYSKISEMVIWGLSFLLRFLKRLVGIAFKVLLPLLIVYLLIEVYRENADHKKYQTPDHRDAAIAVNDPIDPDMPEGPVTYLDQGWDPGQSSWFYFATQGSNLIPYDFFLNLEQKESQALFKDPENINALRYLPQNKNDKGNPDALPVGMTKDTYLGKPYMGFTCAACHTSQINYKDKNGAHKAIRIDGGPAAADMEKFIKQMADALEATRDDEEKLSRFKSALKGQKGGFYQQHEDQIDPDLNRFAVQLRAYIDVNDPLNGSQNPKQQKKPSHYGFARLDAFGRIFNRGLQHVISPHRFRKQLEGKLPIEVVSAVKDDLDEIFGEGPEITYPTPTHAVLRTLIVLDSKTPEAFRPEVVEALRELRTEIYNPADAPASYPYLWDVPQHDYIQWTGLVSNAGLGPLGRNTGQVIGVFGTLDWQKKEGYPYFRIPGILNLLRGGGIGSHHVDFKSSIDKRNLRRVEKQLRDLQSPMWPADEFGNLNQQLIDEGKELFGVYCKECHTNIVRDDPERRIIAHISSVKSVGTDSLLADNAATATGSSGILSGKISGDMLGELVLLEDAPVPAILRTATQGVVTTGDPDKWFFERATQWSWDFFRSLRDNDVKPSRRMGDYNLPTPQKPYAPITGYKARALNGIWATAPYMHNGSIPNLYEVLLPKREADSLDEDGQGQKIEYRSDIFMVGSRQFDKDKVGFKMSDYPDGQGFIFDTKLRGNSNEGHNYATLSADKLPVLSKGQRMALLEYLKNL